MAFNVTISIIFAKLNQGLNFYTVQHNSIWYSFHSKIQDCAHGYKTENTNGNGIEVLAKDLYTATALARTHTLHVTGQAL